MNDLLKKNINIIISIFILIQPILDLLTGICLHIFNINLTIGIFVRVIFLLLIMYIILLKKKTIPLITYFIIFIYSILYLLGIIIYKDSGLFTEVQGLVKVFYFPIILISLYSLKDEIKINKMTIFITLIIYLFLILIPTLLGIGFKTYEITKSGTLGFFNSANEISGIISILTPLMFIYLIDIKNIIIKLLIGITYIFIILTIGTKTPLLSLLITLGLSFLYLICNAIKKKKYKLITTSTIIIILGLISLILVIPKTNFYKNIEVHLDFLEVDNILDVFKEKELIDHFIFSQRLTFLDNKNKVYSNSSTYEKLFGIGYTNNSIMTKQIEIDYFDILYNHGIIGFIIFFGIYAYVFIKVLKERNKDKSYENYMLKTSIFLVILLSFFTGHIITAPAVSIFAIALILSLNKTKKSIIYLTDNEKNTYKINDIVINNENLIIENTNSSKLKVLLFNYHNYDIAIYSKDKDKVLASLYAKKTYKYSNKLKKIEL